jgi:hypothetical protein
MTLQERIQERRDRAAARADLVAYAFLSVFLVLFQLMIMYTVLDDLMNNVLYGLALALHADMTLIARLLLIWHYLPGILLVALIIWAVVSSLREEGDTYYGGQYR